MRCVAAFSCPLACVRLAFAAATALVVAGCSSETARFNENPFITKSRLSSPEVTGSIPAKSEAKVASQSLPPPPQASPVATQPSSPVQSVKPAATGATPSEGRLAANTPKPATGVASKTHVVAPGETLFKVARQYHVSLSELAAANNIPPHTKIKVGDQLVIPGKATSPAPAAARTTAQASNASQNTSQQAANNARKIAPAAEPQAEKPAAALSFRWPVRGRVIAGFGPKPSGQQNDGINLAVPEGTPIRAAEDGVVAYAGNELKSYGNLVLIRHANGFVTAYAHASEILVKRDEQVRRGQVIAKAGQTGSVSSPQLHFEIRKGATPVDPLPYLERSGA